MDLFFQHGQLDCQNCVRFKLRHHERYIRAAINGTVFTLCSGLYICCGLTLRRSKQITRSALLTLCFAATLLLWVILVWPHVTFADFKMLGGVHFDNFHRRFSREKIYNNLLVPWWDPGRSALFSTIRRFFTMSRYRICESLMSYAGCPLCKIFRSYTKSHFSYFKSFLHTLSCTICKIYWLSVLSTLKMVLES